jgi:uncharacterized protein (TIGR03083 family)
MALDYLSHLRTESDRFLTVLRGADPTARVPSCPDWDAADLLWHLAEVQWFWGSIVEERRQSPDGLEPPARPPTYDELLALFESQSHRLHEVLSAAPVDEAVWMWSDDKTAGYIRRRQAHEALIHRLDAELATGDVSPLPSDLASDGVHEVLDMMYGGCPPWGSFTAEDTHLAVRVTDTGLTVPLVLGRFTGTDPDDGKTYDDEEFSVRFADPSAEPVAVISGTAEELDAWLWHRRDDSSITVEGDRAAYDQVVKVLSQPLN